MNSESRGRAWTALLALVLFVASAWYLVEHFQWRDAFSRLVRVDFIRLMLVLGVIHFAYICVRTWRWHMLVKRVNSGVGFWDLYWITAVTVSLAILTPSQLGEVLKIEVLSRRDLLSRFPGLGAFALERIMDVLVLACVGLAGLAFGSGLSSRYPWLGMGVGLLILAGLLALYLLARFRAGGRVAHAFEQIRVGSGSPVLWLKAALLTMLAWMLIGACWQVALHAVEIQLSLPEVMWLIALITLGTILSLIPGGLGVAEVLTVEALANMGVGLMAAQAGALILRVYALIVILFGLFHLLLWLSRRFFHSGHHDSTH